MRPRAKKRLRRLFLVTLVVAVGLYAARNRFLAPALLSLTADRLAQRGARLEVEGLEGSWFTGLGVEGVLFRRGSLALPLEELSGGSARVRYSIPGLIRGGLGGIRQVDLDVEHVTLALGASTEEDDEEPEAAAPAPLPEGLPPVKARIGTLVLRLADGRRVTVREARAELRPGPRGEPFEVTVAGASLDGRRLPALELRGEYRAGRIELRTLRAGDLLLEDGFLDLTGAPVGGALSMTWQASITHRASRARLSGGLAGGRLEAALEDGHLDLADLTPLLPPDEPPLTGTLRIEGRADLPLDDPLAGTASLDVLGETLAGRGVEVRELRATLRLEDEVLRVPQLGVASGVNSLAAHEIEVPLTARDPLALLLAARGALDVSIADVTPCLELAGRPPEHPLPPHRIELALRATGSDVAIERGRVETAGGSFVVQRGALTIPEGAHGISEVLLDSAWTLSFEDVGELFRLAGQDGWRGGLQGELVAEGPLGAPRGKLDVTATKLGLGTRELGDARILARLEGDVLEVQDLTVTAGEAELAAHGTWYLEEQRADDVACEVTVPSLEALGLEALAGGPARLEARLAGTLEAPEGELEIEGSDLIVGGLELAETRLIASAADGRVDVKQLGLLTGDSTRLDATAELAVPRPGEEIRVELRTLRVAHEGTELALVEPASFLLRGEDLEVGPLRLDGDVGSATLLARRTGERTEVELGLARFAPGPVLRPFLPAGLDPGVLDGQVELELGTDAPAASARLTIERLVPATGAGAWSASLESGLDGGRLLARLEARREGGGELSLTGALPLELGGSDLLGEGEVELKATVTLPELIAPPRLLAAGLDLRAAALEARVDLAGTWSDLRGEVEAWARQITARDAEGRELLPGTAELSVGLGLADRIELTRASLELPIGRIRLQGGLATGLDVRRLLGEGAAGLEPTPLDLDLRVNLDEVSWLGRYSDALRRIDGMVEGEVKVRGTLGDPIPSGTLVWREGELRLDADLPLMTSVSSRITLDEDLLELEELRGEWGGSAFVVEGKVEDWLAEPRIDLSLKGQDLLLFRGGRTRVRAHTNLTVRGPVESLAATGELVLVDSRLGERIDLFAGLRPGQSRPSTHERGLALSFFRTPPLSDMRFDLSIRAEDPFVVKNNLAQGGLRPDIHLRGTGEVPLIEGNVFLDPTRLSLPSGRLVINGGLVRFTREDPFVPQLEFTGELRVKGYDIRAVVNGPYDSPEIELSSTPPLPNDDLLLLFLTGQAPIGSTADRGAQAAQTVAVFLTQDLLLSFFTDGSDDGASLLDRFDFQIGADVTRSGAPTAEAYFYLRDRPRGPGRAPYLLVERDTYDKVNLGFGIMFRFP